MTTVRFEWDPSRRFGCEEALPGTTELPFIPGIGTEIEDSITGANWKITRTCWVMEEEPEQSSLIIFVV